MCREGRVKNPALLFVPGQGAAIRRARPPQPAECEISAIYIPQRGW
jgi:hypothetical protein